MKADSNLFLAILGLLALLMLTVPLVYLFYENSNLARHARALDSQDADLNLQLGRVNRSLIDAQNQITSCDGQLLQANQGISSCQSGNTVLTLENSNLSSQLAALQTANAINQNEINQLKANVLFKGGNATMYYSLSDGNSYFATYDVSSLNYYVDEGFLNRLIISDYRNGNSINPLTQFFGSERMARFDNAGQVSPVWLLQGASGQTISIDNYMAFKDTQSSAILSLAKSIQSHSSSDSNFVYNVLLLKTQVNSYSFNIVGQPRYPLETLLEGGGDCGASSLFVGSMIKAAHPNWKVQLWLVNSNSISAPGDTIDHAIVYVDNGADVKEFIETTADNPLTALSYYDGQVVRGYSYDF